MKRKLTYLLGLLLIASAVWADDCGVSYYGYHGTYDNPYLLVTDSFIVENPTTSLGQKITLPPKAGLTVYQVDAGRITQETEASSTVGVFKYNPTTEHPYINVWYTVEMTFGRSGHRPVHGQISVCDVHGDTISCPYFYSSEPCEAIMYDYEAMRNAGWYPGVLMPTSTHDNWYRKWEMLCLDLTDYIDQTITITALCTTCSTEGCTSLIYLAFEQVNNITIEGICYSSDTISINGPSGYKNYVWHKGSPTGSIVGTDSILTINGKWNITNYYCTVSGLCGELTYVAPVQDVRSVFNYDLHCGVDNAKDTVYFTNTSFKQKRIAPYTMEECDAFYWDFGNGQTSTQRAPGYVLYDKGKQVTVRLRTGTEDFACDAWSDVTFRTCDKYDSIPLNPMPNVPITDSIDSIVCHGTIVEWHDMYLTETGIYRDTLLSKTWGTDSIYYVLNLTVLNEPVEILPLDTASCNMVPFLWRGHQIVSDTTCYDTIRTTKIGCDSIYASLRFVTLASGSSEVTKVICDKQLPYPWKDLSCTKEGDYTFDTLTTHGCDSTITLHLIVKDHAENDTTAYICNKDLPFIWHGKVAQNGDTIMRKNAVGCDSIVTLKLFVSAAPVTLPQKDTTSCQMVPFMWRGHQIVGDTLCYDTLRTTKLGCDSIYASLRFVVKEPSASDTTAYTCYGTPFIWHGKEAKDGDTIMLINSVGCDSIVTLRLTTSAKPIVWSIDTTICDTLLPFTWRDIFYTSVLTWRDTIHNAQGCDSIYRSFTLDTIHCVRPEPPVPPEPPVDTCLSDLVYKKWVDLIFCDNGKDDFVAYQWYRDEQALSGETRQYLYLPNGMGPAEYFVEVTYVNGQHMRTCPKTFDNIPRSADTYVKMPTVIRRGESIHIELSDAEARIRFYDAAGRLIREEMVYNHSDLPQSFLPGAYVAEVDGEHVHEAVKMIVY